MKQSEAILKRINQLLKEPFVTDKFGDEWKSYAKKNINVDDIIDIAHKQGRKAILLERAIQELLGDS